MDGHRDHRQVDIVEHDRHLVMQASPGMEVQAQHTAADCGDPGHVPQPGRQASGLREWCWRVPAALQVSPHGNLPRTQTLCVHRLIQSLPAKNSAR